MAQMRKEAEAIAVHHSELVDTLRMQHMAETQSLRETVQMMRTEHKERLDQAYMPEHQRQVVAVENKRLDEREERLRTERAQHHEVGYAVRPSCTLLPLLLMRGHGRHAY
jgi:hypothetical protein